MSLKDDIQAAITAAQKDQDALRLSTLRLMLAAIMNAEVAGKEKIELTNDQTIDVLRSESKKRAESAEIYEQNGRAESAQKERAEAAIIAEFLPAAMDDSALNAIVAEEVANAKAAGADGPKAMGVVVKAVRERVGQGADGSRIAAAVKSALG
jgi:uncharacterized protein YqeY